MRRALGAVIGLYALYAAAAIFLHPAFIYPFDQTEFDRPGYVQVSVPSDAGAINLAYAEGASDAPAILFFMGNTGALNRFPTALALHREAGRTVVALEYPGGGGHPGYPSEEGLKAQALAAYDWLDARSDQGIVVHGYSLGTALALHVADRRQVTGVMLDAPFVRLCELMARQSALPACWMPGVQKWDSTQSLGRIEAPVQIQHGRRDQLVPIQDGRRLMVLMQELGIDVTLIAVRGGTHNNLFRRPNYAENVAGFLDTITP